MEEQDFHTDYIQPEKSEEEVEEIPDNLFEEDEDEEDEEEEDED